MQERARSASDRDQDSTASWPWDCLDCGATIYHDGEHCRTCAAAHRLQEAASATGERPGFVDWMRHESAASLSLKVAAVASLEVGLTALWLQLAWVGVRSGGLPVPL